MYPIPFRKKFSRIVHIDAYRLKNGRELAALSWSAVLADPKNLVLLEWPEHVHEVIPKEAIRVTVTVLPDDTRTITYAR